MGIAAPLSMNHAWNFSIKAPALSPDRICHGGYEIESDFSDLSGYCPEGWTCLSNRACGYETTRTTSVSKSTTTEEVLTRLKDTARDIHDQVIQRGGNTELTEHAVESFATKEHSYQGLESCLQWILDDAQASTSSHLPRTIGIDTTRVNPENQPVGQFVVGGYNFAAVNGPWIELPMVSGQRTAQCLLQVPIKNVTLVDRLGDQLWSATDDGLMACIDPLLNQAVEIRKASALNAQLQSWCTEAYRDSLPDQSVAMQAYRRAKLQNAHEVQIVLEGDHEVVVPWQQFPLHDPSYDTKENGVVGRQKFDAQEWATFSIVVGAPFLRSSYLYVDFDRGKFSIAPSGAYAVPEISNSPTMQEHTLESIKDTGFFQFLQMLHQKDNTHVLLVPFVSSAVVVVSFSALVLCRQCLHRVQGNCKEQAPKISFEQAGLVFSNAAYLSSPSYIAVTANRNVTITSECGVSRTSIRIGSADASSTVISDTFTELNGRAGSALADRLSSSSAAISAANGPDLRSHDLRGKGGFHSPAPSSILTSSTENDFQLMGSKESATSRCSTLDPKKEFAENPLYLFVCKRLGGYASIMEAVEVQHIKSDQELFEVLKMQCCGGFIRSLYTLRRLRTIRFVRVSLCEQPQSPAITDSKRFQLRKNGLVDNVTPNVLPPSDARHYQFHPRKPDIIPPIGSNHLLHLLQHPHHGFGDTLCLDQLPKRIGKRPRRGEAPDHPFCYGVEFMFEFHRPKFATLFCSLTVLGSLVFAASYWASARNPQTAFTAAAFFTSFGSMCLGVWQIWLLA